MSSESDGVPPTTSTLTVSSKVTVAVTVSPTLRKSLSRPVAPLSTVEMTLGAVVLMVIVWLALDGLALPAWSLSSALRL